MSQQPWIENATFRDNILFGLPYDHERYEDVVFACALAQDRHILSDADDTEIGANGINLSGGQKWRITLARALYSRAGILIMDDIFSAVDAHVGRHIYEHALCGKLGRNRTKILATHHVSLVLDAAKYAIRLDNGRVEYADYVDNLRKTGALQQILAASDEEQAAAVEEGENTVDVDTVVVADGDNEGVLALHSEPRQLVLHEGQEDIPQRRRSSARRDSQLSKTRPFNGQAKKPENIPKKFIEDEAKQSGRIATAVYLRYWKANGYVEYWLPYLSVLFINEALRLSQVSETHTKSDLL